MLIEIEGVVKFEDEVERLVDNNVPPTAASYQRNVPLLDDVADNETGPVPHVDPATIDGAAGVLFITALITVRVELVHEPLSNST